LILHEDIHPIELVVLGCFISFAFKDLLYFEILTQQFRKQPVNRIYCSTLLHPIFVVSKIGKNGEGNAKPMRERIEDLNQLMRGWVNYFKNATGYQKLKDLDAWIRCRLRYCIWKQWKRPKRRLRAFRQLGVETSWARRFAYSRMGGWAIACSPIMGTTVTEARLRQKGYIPFLEYYLHAKYGNKAETGPM